MGTRGLYGLRKNGIDKTSYNHWDSYPDGLGAVILNFIRKHSIAVMDEFYDRIIMVNEDASPTAEEQENCRQNESINLSVSNQSVDDWYCLLREMQGNLDKLYECKFPYMINNSDFIKDSLFCEYAYIINLDTNMLEYYEGFQHNAQKGNRYGEIPDEDGYYPCKLSAEIPLEQIYNAESIDAIINEFMVSKEED